MHLYLAPANVHESDVVLDSTEATIGWLLGDCNYWLPDLKARMPQLSIALVTPLRTAKHAPPHSWSAVLGRVHYGTFSKKNLRTTLAKKGSTDDKRVL